MNETTHGFSHGNKKRKPSIPLKKLVMEALLSAYSTGMVVSEIYEFVNSRCKEYSLAENRPKWKINVRNMLTTSVYLTASVIRNATAAEAGAGNSTQMPTIFICK